VGNSKWPSGALGASTISTRENEPEETPVRLLGRLDRTSAIQWCQISHPAQEVIPLNS